MANTVQDSTNQIHMARSTRPWGCRFSATAATIVRWGLCVAVAVQLCGQAYGSCGDYLEHGPNHSGALTENFQVVPSNGPTDGPSQSRCRNGNCRGQVPVNVPTHDKLRWDDRRSDMSISLSAEASTARQQFAKAVDEHLASQAILEVLVPPPRS